MNDVLSLVVSFGRVGLFGFGGGPSMVPLIEQEVVSINHWLSPESFLDAFTFANSLPGPIATKMAAHVGYVVAGVTGSVVAVLAVSIPTIAAMVAFTSVYWRFRHNKLAAGFVLGIRPVVVALLALVVWDYAPSAFGRSLDWQWLRAVILGAATVVATVRFKTHPVLCILAGGLIGAVLG